MCARSQNNQNAGMQNQSDGFTLPGKEAGRAHSKKIFNHLSHPLTGPQTPHPSACSWLVFHPAPISTSIFLLPLSKNLILYTSLDDMWTSCSDVPAVQTQKTPELFFILMLDYLGIIIVVLLAFFFFLTIDLFVNLNWIKFIWIL